MVGGKDKEKNITMEILVYLKKKKIKVSCAI